MSSFRALNISNSERFRALNFSNLDKRNEKKNSNKLLGLRAKYEIFRALKFSKHENFLAINLSNPAI